MILAAHERPAALAELERVPLGLPAGLELEWLGVAGYRLTLRGRLDPRRPVRLARAAAQRAPAPPRAPRRRADRPPRRAAPSAVLIGHTHWDHAVDAPALARRDGATVYGSDSLARLMALHGHDSVIVEPHRAYEIGPFVVRFVAQPALEAAVRPQGPVRRPAHLRGPARRSRPCAYKCGDVFGIRIEVAGTSFYHQGSADLRRRRSASIRVDVFLAGITGRQVTPRYWERILPRLDPRRARPHPLRRLLRAAGPAAEAGAAGRDRAASRTRSRAVSGATTLAAVPRDPARPPATPGA